MQDEAEKATEWSDRVALLTSALAVAKQVSQKALHRSFPEAGDGRPLPTMGDELMTAGLNAEDARFVAVQLAQNGLVLVPADTIEALRAEVERLRKQCDGLAQAAMNNGQALILAEAERDRLREALDGVLWMAEQWYEHGGNETTLADEYLVALEKARALTTKGEADG